jgi:NAD-dependent SIR2 family protein deacetylase
VWTLNPKAERMSDIRYYVADREVRKLSWQSRSHIRLGLRSRITGHRALVALEKRGKLHALVTQNIDGCISARAAVPSSFWKFMETCIRRYAWAAAGKARCRTCSNACAKATKIRRAKPAAAY